jgi:hypothetical protein
MVFAWESAFFILSKILLQFSFFEKKNFFVPIFGILFFKSPKKEMFLAILLDMYSWLL